LGIPLEARAYSNVLELVADGMSLRRACARVGISRSTWWRALQADSDLWSRYARARELQAEALASDIRDLADSVTPETANADRVRIDALKWIAAKLHPKVYGDYAGRPDAGSVTITLQQLHLDAVSRSTEELQACVARVQRPSLPPAEAAEEP
jgi:hypothetical protein